MTRLASASTFVQVAQSPSMLVVTTAEASMVIVRGDVDLTITGPLSKRLTEELELRPAALIIDLREATFCSSCGLSALARACEAARRAEVPFAIVTTQHAVLRPARLLGLDRTLPIHRTLPEAQEWLGLVNGLR
ncbi:STAS domain-containing protein [Amycolatopsis sp. NPDC051373]|uniref:STAS domain-containing protein n=1 Tax=Amycolatopsis sp. NPDC051373 TaxID=3155801 RepID=UPI00344DB7D3